MTTVYAMVHWLRPRPRPWPWSLCIYIHLNVYYIYGFRNPRLSKYLRKASTFYAPSSAKEHRTLHSFQRRLGVLVNALILSNEVQLLYARDVNKATDSKAKAKAEAEASVPWHKL